MNVTLDPQRDRLTTSYIMGLIVATALSLFLLESCYGMKLFANELKSSRSLHFLDVCGVVGGCLLLPFAFTLPLMRIYGNRLPWRETVQEIGFVSCVVVAVTTLEPLSLFASRCLYAVQNHRTDMFKSNFENSFREVTMQAGPAILGAWIALLLVGRWRLKSGWMDLAGFLVGLSFFLLFLHAKVYNILFPFL